MYPANEFGSTAYGVWRAASMRLAGMIVALPGCAGVPLIGNAIALVQPIAQVDQFAATRTKRSIRVGGVRWSRLAAAGAVDGFHTRQQATWKVMVERHWRTRNMSSPYAMKRMKIGRAHGWTPVT